MRARRRLGCGAPLPVSSQPQQTCGFCAMVHDNPVTAPPATRPATQAAEPTPPHPTVIDLSVLLAKPAVRSALKPVPFYSGYRIHLAGEGWVWYLSTQGNEPMPRVRAVDGAPWPYRQPRPSR